MRTQRDHLTAKERDRQGGSKPEKSFSLALLEGLQTPTTCAPRKGSDKSLPLPKAKRRVARKRPALAHLTRCLLALLATALIYFAAELALHASAHAFDIQQGQEK